MFQYHNNTFFRRLQCVCLNAVLCNFMLFFHSSPFPFTNENFHSCWIRLSIRLFSHKTHRIFFNLKKNSRVWSQLNGHAYWRQGKCRSLNLRLQKKTHIFLRPDTGAKLIRMSKNRTQIVFEVFVDSETANSTREMVRRCSSSFFWIFFLSLHIHSNT